MDLKLFSSVGVGGIQGCEMALMASLPLSGLRIVYLQHLATYLIYCRVLHTMDGCDVDVFWYVEVGFPMFARRLIWMKAGSW